jgi:hypothetical protein
MPVLHELRLEVMLGRNILEIKSISVAIRREEMLEDRPTGRHQITPNVNNLGLWQARQNNPIQRKFDGILSVTTAEP